MVLSEAVRKLRIELFSSILITEQSKQPVGPHKSLLQTHHKVCSHHSGFSYVSACAQGLLEGSERLNGVGEGQNGAGNRWVYGHPSWGGVCVCWARIQPLGQILIHVPSSIQLPELVLILGVQLAVVPFRQLCATWGEGEYIFLYPGSTGAALSPGLDIEQAYRPASRGIGLHP